MDNLRTPSFQDQPATDGAGYTHLGGDPVFEYEALRQSAALVDHSDRTVLRLSGKDPIGMLNAILTNTVPQDGGAYAALLDQKGRVQTDLLVLKSGDDVIIVTEPEGAEAAKSILGRYAPFSRVKLEDLSGMDPPWTVLGLYGPHAKEMLGDPDLPEPRSAEVTLNGLTVLAACVAMPLSGYDFLGPAETLDSVRDALLKKGAAPAGRDAFETARIEAGVPRFGSDITPDNFPSESDGFLKRAVSFEKGCYPGQETVARMRYRGSPNKRLYRFALDGEPPVSGAQIIQSGKQVGTITSVAPLPVDGTTYALGYLSRKAEPQNRFHAGDAKLRALLE